jgi:hypothetical protein
MPEITDEQFELLKKYEEIGKPEDISNELNAKAILERENTLQEVSQVTGYKPNVLAKLSEGLDLKVEEGQAYVGEVPIQDYANEQWAEFLPSLKEDSKPVGVNYVRQAAKATDRRTPLTNASSFLKGLYGSKDTVIN